MEEYPESEFSDSVIDNLKHYRVRNELTISACGDGLVDLDREAVYITIDGTSGSSRSWENINGEDNELRDDWLMDNVFSPLQGTYKESTYGTQAPAFEPAKEAIEVTGDNGNTVEGFRASQIVGGHDTMLSDLSENANAWDLWKNSDISRHEAFFVSNLFTANQKPYFWNFLEGIVMSNGVWVARLWDVSKYPGHALYKDEEFQGAYDFIKGQQWETNEINNDYFIEWGIGAQYGGAGDPIVGSTDPFAAHNKGDYDVPSSPEITTEHKPSEVPANGVDPAAVKAKYPDPHVPDVSDLP